VKPTRSCLCCCVNFGRCVWTTYWCTLIAVNVLLGRVWSSTKSVRRLCRTAWHSTTTAVVADNDSKVFAILQALQPENKVTSVGQVATRSALSVQYMS